MSRLTLVVCLVLVAAVSYRLFGSEETGTGTLTLAQPAPNVGQEVPGFEARTVDGEPFKLSGEGTYVLTYWSSLNKGSDDARPGFLRLAREYEDAGVDFAAVYVSSIPEEERNVPYAVLRDSSGRLSSLYNVKQVPRLFLVRDGQVALVQNGYYRENETQLKRALEEALPNKEARPG